MLAAVALALALPGCLHRRLMVRSDPPGAVVFVDDYEIGTTPVSHDFTYYGTRKIRLVKDGYETLTVLQPIPAPWYEWPPLDFVSENCVPGEIRDYHTLSYRLTPQVVVPVDELRQRAEQLRQDAHSQGVSGVSPHEIFQVPNATLPQQPARAPYVAPGTEVPNAGFPPEPATQPYVSPGPQVPNAGFPPQPATQPYVSPGLQPAAPSPGPFGSFTPP